LHKFSIIVKFLHKSCCISFFDNIFVDILVDKEQNIHYNILLYKSFIPSGGVQGSTGILKQQERAAVSNALKGSNLNINANDNLAYAA